MMTHKALVRKMLRQPSVKVEYDAQAEGFALLDELLKARRQAGLTQAEVAARMGTKKPAVARLEAGGGSRRHSPSVATLRKYCARRWLPPGDPFTAPRRGKFRGRTSRCSRPATRMTPSRASAPAPREPAAERVVRHSVADRISVLGR